MTSARPVLERIGERVRVRQPAFERLMRRRDRKRRNRRMAAVAVALVVSVSAAGAFLKAFEGDTTKPASSINPGNVGDLVPSWTAHLDGAPSGDLVFNGGRSARYAAEPSPPIVANGVLYLSTRAGTVYAFPEHCSATCAPLWTAAVGSPVSSPPTVDGGMVFVSTDHGGLLAFRTGCGSGGAACAPEWVAHLKGRMLSSPVVASGIVYGIDDAGEAVAFPTHCGTGGSTCSPLWTAPLRADTGCGSNPQFVDRPTVADGIVFAVAPSHTRLSALDAKTGRLLWFGVGGSNPCFADPSPQAPTVDGNLVIESFPELLAAFPAGCRSDGQRCAPRWIADHLDRSFFGPQAVSQGRVYEVGAPLSADTAILFSIDERCGERCGRIGMSTGVDPSAPDHPLVIADGLIFVSSPEGRFEAFPASCGLHGIRGEPCGVVWEAFLSGLGGSFPPTVAAGVVLMGSGSQYGSVYAFPTDCAGVCSPLWKSGSFGTAVSSPAIDGNAIFVDANDQTLRAFSVDPGATPARLSGSGRREAAVFYTGIGVVVIVLLLVRWRRRRRPAVRAT